jgi:hypothetical protein
MLKLAVADTSVLCAKGSSATSNPAYPTFEEAMGTGMSWVAQCEAGNGVCRVFLGVATQVVLSERVNNELIVIHDPCAPCCEA